MCRVLYLYPCGAAAKLAVICSLSYTGYSSPFFYILISCDVILHLKTFPSCINTIDQHCLIFVVLECPSNLISMPEGCFYVETNYRNRKSWDDAEAFCQTFGNHVHLARVDTQQVGFCDQILPRGNSMTELLV